MKNIIRHFTLFVLLFLGLSACTSTRSNRDNKQKQNTATMNQPTTYEPGPGWKLVWQDEFDGDSINPDNWNFQVVKAGRFNEEWQRYTNSSRNAYIEDNCLVIKAIHESEKHGINQYTSARLHTANKQSWMYGKIAARIKLPEGEGIWPAFWMLGANIDENGGDTPWPQSGEIDILELYGSKDDAVVEANAHYANTAGEHDMMGAKAFKLKNGKFADDFHVFELEWDARKLVWLVDGVSYAEMLIPSGKFPAFHKEFFILLNIAVGGTHAGRPDQTTKFPQTMLVDWVRVYQKQ